MKQEECNVCFEMKEMYNNCCTFNTCNECLFLIDEENCLQCQKPKPYVAITIPEPEPTPNPFFIFIINVITLLLLILLIPLNFIEFIFGLICSCWNYEYNFYLTYQIEKFMWKIGLYISF
jgi:hypothetical protein